MSKIRLKELPHVGSLLKSYFLAGLMIVIPLGVIAWILGAALQSIWGLLEWLPEQWRPDNLLPNPQLAFLVNVAVTLGIALVLALATSIIGWVSRLYLGQLILRLISFFIQRIPVIRSVYSSLDQLLRAFASGGGGQFSRVVYVEYPRKEMWTLAFVTGQLKTDKLPPGHVNLFVPTTPNPTSGFYLIAHESQVKESGLKVEEAFKVLLSLGIAGK